MSPPIRGYTRVLPDRLSTYECTSPATKCKRLTEGRMSVYGKLPIVLDCMLSI